MCPVVPAGGSDHLYHVDYDTLCTSQHPRPAPHLRVTLGSSRLQHATALLGGWESQATPFPHVGVWLPAVVLKLLCFSEPLTGQLCLQPRLH